MYSQRRKPKLSIFHTAGWLFADLLLALTIIFIAASATGKPVLRAKTITPTATATAIPTPIPQIQGLDRKAITMQFLADPTQLGQKSIIASIKKQMIQKLNQSHNANRKVGFVLTFAGGADGVHNAGSFNTIITTIPAFKNAVFKNYHDLTNPDNEFDLEIYLLLTI